MRCCYNIIQIVVYSSRLFLYSYLPILLQALIRPPIRSTPSEAPRMKLPWIFVSIVTVSVTDERSSPIFYHSIATAKPTSSGKLTVSAEGEGRKIDDLVVPDSAAVSLSPPSEGTCILRIRSLS